MTLSHRRGARLLAAILAVLLIVSLVWDWNWFKRPFERLVYEQTGRHLFIDGNLDVDLGWQPRISLEHARFQNADWARLPEMAVAERVSFSLGLQELLRGDVFFPIVELRGARIDLEVGKDGRNNWTLSRDAADGKPDDPATAQLPIGSLRIERGELRYFDPAQKTDVLVAVSTVDDNGTAGIRISAAGQYQSLEVDAEASGGGLLTVTDQDAPYPLKARFRLGRTRGTLDGTITGFQRFSAAQLQLDIRGDTLAALHPLTALALPETPPYRIEGRLIRKGERWTFENFAGEVGDSDLSGTATVTYSAQRPRLVANLNSRQLDLDDLAGFIGGTPQASAGETASPLQEKEAAKESTNPRVLPDRPVNLAQLRSMDADVRFTAKSIRSQGLPLDDLKVHLLLEQGQLRLDPLDFGVAGGSILSTVSIDARQNAPAMKTTISFTRLDLAKLLPGNPRVQAGAGLIGGRASLSGSGNSTAALLASLDGDLGVAMRNGKFSNLLIEGIGLDGAEALRFLIGGDKTVRLRCAVMDFAAKDGVLTPRSFVVDTTDTNLHVDGSLSLRDETLDLTLHALPKDWSPLSLRSPLHIRGTFKNPRVGVDRALFLRGGVAALLGALVNPLAALLPLIETGPGEDADCGALLTAVRSAPAAVSGAPS